MSLQDRRVLNVKPKQKPALLSGFCNPSLPRTDLYDPHTRCSGGGCPCACHVPLAHRPRVPLLCLQRRCDHDHDQETNR